MRLKDQKLRVKKVRQKKQIEYTGFIAKVGRQEGGYPIDCRLKTRDRHYQRPSEQYAQPLLESMIYVARRTRIVAPARSTILRRVGLLAALSSAARGPLIFVVGIPLRRSNLDLEIPVNP